MCPVWSVQPYSSTVRGKPLLHTPKCCFDPRSNRTDEPSTNGPSATRHWMPVVGRKQAHYTLTKWVLPFNSYYLSCSLSLGSVSSPPKAVCEVRAKAVFPTLQVTDACSGGSVRRLSKVQLWKLFSLDSLNEQLLAIPSPAELMYKPRRSEVKAQRSGAEYTIRT